MQNPIRHGHAYSYDEDGTVLLCQFLLPLDRSELRIQGPCLLRVDESDLVRQGLCAGGIVLGDQELGALDSLVDPCHDALEEVQVPLAVCHHALPVPLVNVNGMDVVYVIIRTDGVHVRVKTCSRLKAMVGQSHPLPFGKALHYLHGGLIHVSHIEPDRTLNTVEVIVDSAVRLDEKR